MNQIIPGAYHLEVSSPGLDRPLRTLESIERFSGQRVTLTTHEAHDGRRRYDGLLLGARDTQAGVRTDEGQEYWFDWSDVKSARLVVDPWAEKRKAKAEASDARRSRGGAE